MRIDVVSPWTFLIVVSPHHDRGVTEESRCGKDVFRIVDRQGRRNSVTKQVRIDGMTEGGPGSFDDLGVDAGPRKRAAVIRHPQPIADFPVKSTVSAHKRRAMN